MKRYERDIFEEMDYIIDKFFTELENTIIEEEPKETKEKGKKCSTNI